ncbi:MAG: alpha-amylase family glycosyl hydrolase [Paludibacter sp.]|nr:alpha-amylase family glycosyl hydrolase [Bacteroidales bacterium]MCM1069984.1 alpha-amylase family glycosyl hydrolase [Prevotella sp.]MCM1354738.1 alpha-amylase family glycosyl hydrolase [Bacteroides sp.]MCM1443588.1 alpha-amylase family glycosyl hydrolase [Muribaculum sp.]MCM1482663.1 alpha-amylase family glycosyl hydrolase [Paludibacter sp.]
MSKHIIYQLLPRTFTNYSETRKHNGSITENGCGKFNTITPKALREIRKLGATHVWYTGVIEHATQTDYTQYGIRKDTTSVVKGKAGSPYAIKDYYDVDPDLAIDVPHRMKEFESLIERTHKAGLKVIIDFVPNHVAREYHSDTKPAGVVDLGENDHPEWAFSPLNNFYYLPDQKFTPQFDCIDYNEFPAKVTGNDCFTANPSVNDWYETVKLNYGVFYQGGMEKQFSPIPDTWNKMLDILLFWAAKGIDGFRCDMAEMVPVEFWQWAIKQVKEQYSDILFIAEVYNPDLYRAYIFDGGFDLLYDKVGMYDYLRGVTSKDYPAEGITRQWQSTDDIRCHMLYFLENHDEQRIASGFFCGRGICAEPAMIVLTLLGENPVMIYAGQELGELGMDSEGFSGVDGRTSIFDYWAVRSLQAWANKGKFNGALLTDEQKELRTFYARLLQIATTEKAITDGRMFDLEYAQGIGFNREKNYAFLRQYQNELLLVIVNFDARQSQVRLAIPKAAFTYLDIECAENMSFIDLLTDKNYTLTLQPETPIEVEIPAWQGLVLKTKISEKK